MIEKAQDLNDSLKKAQKCTKGHKNTLFQKHYLWCKDSEAAQDVDESLKKARKCTEGHKNTPYLKASVQTRKQYINIQFLIQSICHVSKSGCVCFRHSGTLWWIVDLVVLLCLVCWLLSNLCIPICFHHMMRWCIVCLLPPDACVQHKII